ncbi:MAG: 1-acyl-sn-glycerol-3-phosphate acyltransferase [Alphaproteobacteria bacterium PA4]|nr:MAG: 1-acyl-sn-glycerol-3-phosphate acyltransferase [Alphaproteobacteria bacterium PA4]
MDSETASRPGVLATLVRHPVACLRLGWRVALLAGALAICLPPHLVMRRLTGSWRWAQRFLGIAARICGARVSHSGPMLGRDVFFVANHLSWIDICIFGGVTGTAFVAQDKIRDWPVIGRLAQLNRTVFVSREARLMVSQQIIELREALAAHQPVTLFPEGTTTDGRSLLPFKPPLFAVLLPPPRALRIQPVCLHFDDAGKDLAWIGVETAPENAWRVFTRPGSFRVHVEFLDPFDPGDHPDRKAISAESRRRITAALARELGAPVA